MRAYSLFRFVLIN